MPTSVVGSRIVLIQAMLRESPGRARAALRLALGGGGLGRSRRNELDVDVVYLVGEAVGEAPYERAQELPLAPGLARAHDRARDHAVDVSPAHPARVRRVRVYDPPAAILRGERPKAPGPHRPAKLREQLRAIAFHELEANHRILPLAEVYAPRLSFSREYCQSARSTVRIESDRRCASARHSPT